MNRYDLRGRIAIVTGGAGGLAQPLVSTDALWLSAVAGVLAAGIPSVLFLAGIRSIGGMRTGVLMLFQVWPRSGLESSVPPKPRASSRPSASCISL